MPELQTDRAGLHVSVRNLYKIFGPDAQELLALVKDGIGKEELHNEHDHVLGLSNINLEIESGSLFVIMGLSGSGKSTLIRHINRLIDPTAGEVIIGDEEVTALSLNNLHCFRRDNISMVFQKFALFPHMTVQENAEYSLNVRGIAARQRRAEAKRWLDRVGLNGYEKYYPKQLSGGMQQRVGLARALTANTPIMLMDEAFSALDPLIRHDMQGMLLDLQRELGKTIIFITHDLDEALRLGDHVAILRDGAVQQQGTGQQIVLNPINDYIVDFVRVVNRGRVICCDALMQSEIPEDSNNLPHVKETMVIEEVASIINEANAESALVTNIKGEVVGHLSLSDIINTMVPTCQQ